MPPPRQLECTCFHWSPDKVRIAQFVLAGMMLLPLTVGLLGSAESLRLLCLACLVPIYVQARKFDRALSGTSAVLIVDSRGILDRRLMPRPISWQEIEAICEVNTERSQVIDIQLRWPMETLQGTRWRVRIGACCQAGWNVPAVTISMLLLDGSAIDLIGAIARHRPDLLHPENRCRGIPSAAGE